MERGDVAMTDGFFPTGVLADFLDREIDFNEAFGIGGGWHVIDSYW